MKLTLEIEDLAQAGEGVGHALGRAVFVPYSAPGDRVTVSGSPPAEEGGGPVHAKLLFLEAPGASRVPSPCSHFGEPAGGMPLPPHPGRDRACGGCEWLHVAYPAQLARKAQTVRETLRRIGRLSSDRYEELPALGSPTTLRYRARAKFHFDPESGRLAYFRRRSHEPVRLHECHLLTEGLDNLREAFGPALCSAGLTPTEVALEWSDLEARGSALLRVPDTYSAARRRAESLLAVMPSLSGLVLVSSGLEERAAAVLGDPVLRHLRDPKHPEKGTQRSRPDVFMQANRGANALLVAEAVALLAPSPGDKVLELYSGAGNFTSPLAERARSVAAIEGVLPSLDLLRSDLAERKIGNVRCYAGDALKVGAALGREVAKDPSTYRLVLLDPPRDGAKGVGPLLRDLGAERAVYVSCDPATFARDLAACVKVGFSVAAVRAVDMFPQTHHVEAVALLVRG